jgi:hypothetical protein
LTAKLESADNSADKAGPSCRLSPVKDKFGLLAKTSF